VRVVTCNVHRCRGIDGRCLPERIAAVIAEIDPDVACCRNSMSGAGAAGPCIRSPPLRRFWPCDGHFQSTIQKASGHYGDAILSKTPLRIRRADLLPAVPFAIARETRSAICAQTLVAGREWQIINTHFGLGRDERRRQAARTRRGLDCARAGGAAGGAGRRFQFPPGIARPRHPERLVARSLPSARRTAIALFLEPLPFTCLGYFFVSPEVRITRAERWTSRLARVASDHFPLVVEHA
jgi:endonuclease/exonuclease/phosphatase family metal-dependent hydrolase